MTYPRLPLYHYTSGQSLLGIIESGSLWATSIHYMNDSKEFRHSTALASEALRSLKAGVPNARQGEICDAVINLLERISRISLYVACFSEIRDSLSQWRGYCAPNFGYCIGFDGDHLSRIAEAQGFTLKPCIYDRAMQESHVTGWVQSTVTSLIQLDPGAGDLQAFCDANMGVALTKFLEFAPYLKDQAFRDEREWRLCGLIPAGDRIKLRAGKSLLVPYAPINLPLNDKELPLIWDLLLGPTPHRELAQDAACHLFQKIKIKNGISCSSIPYRDW